MMQPNPTPQCANHPYQMCNSTPYNCNNQQKDYQCNNTPYPPMPSPGYGCGVPSMTEPLASPAMATPAPNNTVSQLQQAQMSRPCNHYGQNCYRYNGCANVGQACNCQKPYPQNKCFHQCSNNEIQCKDISQSQMSPGVVSQANGTKANATGMRQDAYQRTLEYVQNCQSWVGNSEMVSSTTNGAVKCGEAASSNMVVNDMTSSLSSLLEENRYLQMIQ